MTVAELIEHLKTMPPNAPVIQTYCSDYDDVSPSDVTASKLIRRGDHWMSYNEKWWDHAKDGEPVLIDVCHIAGN